MTLEAEDPIIIVPFRMHKSVMVSLYDRTLKENRLPCEYAEDAIKAAIAK
jgi:hypothetical protein